MNFSFCKFNNRGALFFLGTVTRGAFSQSCMLSSSCDENTRPQRGQRNRSLHRIHSQPTTLLCTPSRSCIPPLSSCGERGWDTALRGEAFRPLCLWGLDRSRNSDGPNPKWPRWDSGLKRCEPCRSEHRPSFYLCTQDVCFYPHDLSSDNRSVMDQLSTDPSRCYFVNVGSASHFYQEEPPTPFRD